MPLNTSYALPSALRSGGGYPITELDWWEDRIVRIPATTGGGAVRLTALPAQHFTARGLLDRNHALWASWAIEEVVDEPNGKEGDHQVGIGAKVWFGGDTGAFVRRSRGFSLWRRIVTSLSRALTRFPRHCLCLGQATAPSLTVNTRSTLLHPSVLLSKRLAPNSEGSTLG